MFNAPQTYADDNAEVQKGGSTPRLSSPKSLLLWLTGSFNRSLLVFKLFYFFFFAAFGSLFPLISIYFKQLGLNATQCGVLSGIRSLVECFGAPFWSSLAEKWKKAKEFFIFSLLCWIAFNLAVGFVRPTPEGCLITLLTTPSESVNLSTAPMAIAEIYRNYRYDNVKAMEMDRDVSFPSRDRIGQTPLLLNTELLVDPSAYVGEAWTWGQKVRSRGKTNYAKDLPRFHDPERYPPGSLVMPLYSTVVYSQSKINQIFVVLLLLILVGELFSCPAICLADSCVLLHLEDDPDNTYGKQRMLGSVGWGLMMLFIGIVLDNSASFPEHPCLAPGHRERNYMICFAMFSVLMSCALITATQFTFGYERGQESMYFKVVKDKMARTLLGRQTKNRSKLVNEEDEETPQFAEVSEMAGEGGDSSKVSAKGAQSKPTNEEILERQLGIKLDRSSAPQKAALTEVDPYAEDLASTAQLKVSSTFHVCNAFISSPLIGFSRSTKACPLSDRLICISLDDQLWFTYSRSINVGLCRFFLSIPFLQITKWFQVLHQFSKPRLASFLFVAWFMGLGMGQVFSFLFWHMQELGGSPTLFGIASVINHISEILAYYFSKTVIDRIGEFKRSHSRPCLWQYSLFTCTLIDI
ncbi:unnamed protein product [Protopolystoma xenopodis]|uniref:Major facilitator superfamily associated domain-containing protein n=1 Tax=Protopolystoma xenopodis TaxID=117903 RepID=A0A448XLN9_9PLAT|nr:unnamed protein product [Protopolystoma xenopodis]